MHIQKIEDLKEYYDVIFVADYLVKYKTRLYEEIAKEKTVLVVYDKISNSYRAYDFYDYEDRTFDSLYISGNNLKKIVKLKKIKKIIKKSTLIISGWAEILPIYSILFLHAKKKCIISESGIYESVITGPKAWIKKVLLKFIDLAFVPGIANEELLLRLGFKGKVIRTHGVGLYNRIKQPSFYEKQEVCNFLYVGRLIDIKNVRNLVHSFGKMPKYKLTIAGDGVLLDELKSYGYENVVFLGSVPNDKLPELYQQNDVFILPSLNEPWGLVVEEALNSGLPFIASNHVCSALDILQTSNVGLIFNLEETEGLENAINKIINHNLYNELHKNVCDLDFEKIEYNQIRAFIDNVD